ncbi:exosome 3'-_5 exonuclease subunit ski4 (Csl4) [Savitreella phatthalungensis]
MSVVSIGDEIGLAAENQVGPGTEIRGEVIVATLVGLVRTEPQEGLPLISVVRRSKGGVEGKIETAAGLPLVGSIVLARVLRTNKLQAVCQIVAVGDTPLVDDFAGVIRPADVRATEKDRVRITSSFRPGDIVRAEVISLGDGQNYFLSTAANDLGVLFAWDEAGAPMYPQDWRTMVTERGAIEERKVAKPFI